MTTLSLKDQHSNRCYILVGLPGAGKSFWCDTVLGRRKDPVIPAVICEDDLIQEECDRSGDSFNICADRMNPKDNRAELLRRFNAAIGVRRNIIVDGHNLTEDDRAMFLLALPDSYQKIGLFFSAPHHILQERLKQRAADTGRVTPPASIGILQKRFQGPGQFEFFRTTMIDHLCQYS